MKRRSMRNYKRIAALIICCLFCLIQIQPMQAWAASDVPFGNISDPDVDVNTVGSIEIHDKYGAGISYSLYEVALYAEGGQAYFADAFASYPDDLAKLPAEWNTSADAKELAGQLAAMVEQHAIAADAGSGTTDANGKITFNNLKPGIYMATSKSFTMSDGKTYSSDPILVTVPEAAEVEGESANYQVKVNAKSDATDKPTTPENPPKTPSKPPTKTPSKKPDSKLPQTGVLWWPVPLLFAGGLTCYILGIFMDRRREKRSEEIR